MPYTIYAGVKGRSFCPYCGENIAVTSYKGEHKQTAEMGLNGPKIRWKQAELDVVDQVINGKVRPIQAAHMLGRSVNSINKKVKRVRDAVMQK